MVAKFWREKTQTTTQLHFMSVLAPPTCAMETVLALKLASNAKTMITTKFIPKKPTLCIVQKRAQIMTLAWK